MIAALALAFAGVETSGELRVIETMPGAFPLDTEQQTAEWGPVVDTRARLGLSWSDDAPWAKEAFRAGIEGDLLTGQLFGDTWSLSPLDDRNRHELGATGPESVRLRRLSGALRTPVAEIEVGLVTSHWGMGLVANDGAHDPWFGRADFGDRTIRLRVATQPAGRNVPLFLALAGDKVISDELADTADGDRVLQGVAGLLYRTDAENLGAYVVRREQRDGDGRFIHAWVVDATGGFDREVTTGVHVKVGGELAAIVGQTDVQRTINSPDGVAVRSVGGVATAQLDHARAGAWLKAAYASGDRTSDDDTLGSFRFDRDLDVGMVLFDEVLAAIDLAAIEEASDPELAAVPPDGVESLATEGAFGSAFALQPVAVFSPMKAMELRLGAVVAWATAPIAHPVRTFRNGGVPTNHAGRVSEGRALGAELDWAVASRVASDVPLQPSVSLQGGHAWPSQAASGLIRRADLVLLSGRLRW